jgi:raffinose/stachyose/melibiose transport system permease protein
MAIFIFTGFYETIPRELEESACMDGCSIYRIFSSIMLPMIRPAIVTVAIFTYLQNWNELLFAVTFIKSRNLKTLTAGVMSLVSQYRTEWGQIGAGLLLTAIPSLLIYTFLSKQVQESFRAGAIKG